MTTSADSVEGEVCSDMLLDLALKFPSMHLSRKPLAVCMEYMCTEKSLKMAVPCCVRLVRIGCVRSLYPTQGYTGGKVRPYMLTVLAYMCSVELVTFIYDVFEFMRCNETIDSIHLCQVNFKVGFNDTHYAMFIASGAFIATAL